MSIKNKPDFLRRPGDRSRHESHKFASDYVESTLNTNNNEYLKRQTGTSDLPFLFEN